MKLSDVVKERYGSQATWLTDGIEQLESNSQLLDDLIEMLQDTTCWITSGNHTYVFNKDSCIYGGSTPREAIQAAISKWKEEKK